MEGFVGGSGVTLNLWPKGQARPMEHVFHQDVGPQSGFVSLLERALVKAITNEAWAERSALMEEHTYARILGRARDVRRRVKGDIAKLDADFVIAYIAGVRADGPHGEQDAETTVRIYRHLLEHAEQPERRIPVLVNLGIAEFSLAKRRVDLEGVRRAMSLWTEAERLADDLGHIGSWVTVRSWQTEGDLFLHSVLGDSETIAVALKRQVETVEDTQALVSDSVLFRGTTFLNRVTRAWAAIYGPPGCSTIPTRLIAFRDVVSERRCGGVGSITWTRQDYDRRRNRVERWTDASRESGRLSLLPGFAGVRANLLRAQGLESNDTGLLVSSFADQQESRTWARVLDEGVHDDPLELGILPVYAFADIEVNLSLACLDRPYMRMLADRIAAADLWCDRVGRERCQVRRAWRTDIVAALRYALAISGPTNPDSAFVPRLPSVATSEVWNRAKWVRDEGVKLSRLGSLCPNRPPGLGETRVVRQNTAVEARVSQLREIRFPSRCSLPPRDWSLAPSLYAFTGGSGWNRGVSEWIDVNAERVARDVQAIRACAGHP